MKKILLLSAIWLLSLADISAKSVVFTLANGLEIYQKISGGSIAMLYLTNEGMTIDGKKYAFSDVTGFYISNTDMPTAVDNVSVVDKISYEDNTIIIPAAVKNIGVYSISGTSINANITRAENMTTVDLKTLPTGSYIIKIDNASFKIIKR